MALQCVKKNNAFRLPITDTGDTERGIVLVKSSYVLVSLQLRSTQVTQTWKYVGTLNGERKRKEEKKKE